MSEMSFSAMLEAAKEAGGAGDWPPVGTYDVVVTSATPSRSKSNKLAISIRARVEGGPHDGDGIWHNQYLSPESPAALDIWFRTFESLGVERSFWGAYGSNLDQAAAAVCERIKGAKARARVGTEMYNGEPQMRTKSLSRRAGVPQAGPGMVVAPPQITPPAAPVIPAAPVVAPAGETVKIPRPTF